MAEPHRPGGLLVGHPDRAGGAGGLRAYVDLYEAVPVDWPSATFHVRGEVTLRGMTVPAAGVVVAEMPEPDAGRLR
jgi:hypothetical protein